MVGGPWHFLYQGLEASSYPFAKEEHLGDEPTSPKKSRSDAEFSAFRRRNSSVSTEWKSVRIAPQDGSAGNNLLAECVMVVSDESSSDMECDTPEATQNSESRLSERWCEPWTRDWEYASLRASPGDTVDMNRDPNSQFTTTDAPHDTSNLPSVTSTRPQRWRRKVQTTFPLLISKTTRVSRESLSSPGSSPDDEVFHKGDSAGYSRTAHPLSKSERISEEKSLGIASYVPHHKEPLASSSGPTYNEYGTPRTLNPVSSRQISHHIDEHNRIRDDYVENLRNSLSEYPDSSDLFRKGEKIGQRHRTDQAEQELSNQKNPTLKKIVLSNEEKAKLLDWSHTHPRVENGLEQENPQVNYDPGGEPENNIKSAFSILTNAIKRSFTRSVSAAPETIKHISLNKTKPVYSSKYFGISNSFLRRSSSNCEYRTNPDDSEMDCFSNRVTVAHNDSLNDFKASESDIRWEKGQSQFQKSKPDCSASTRVEDIMPKMLEKFTIREHHHGSTNPDIPFRSRKNSLFSSLRLRSKGSEDTVNNLSSDTWNVFGSFKKKANEKESGERSQTTNFQHFTSVFRSGHQSEAGRTAATENFSSSSDEEFHYKNFPSYTATRASKRRKRMELEAKQKAKQEELKRLHKAQTLQRQLQEIEENQRALEIQGVRLEKALRGESDTAAQDEAQLLHEWFKLSLEKNKLNRYESELLFVAKELELEDQQGRLEQKLREKMLIDPSLKGEKDIMAEEEIFAEMMKIIEQRNQLVIHIEEQRLRERSEEKNLMDLQLPRDRQPNLRIFNYKGKM